MRNVDDYLVDIVRCSLLVRWNQVHSPFEHWKLLQILPERGYVLSQDILSEAIPYGGRLDVSGRVGTKGPVSLILSSDRPGVQLDGTEVSALKEELEAFEALLEEEFGFVSKQNSRFYEVDAQVYVWSHKTPIEVMRSQIAGVSLIGQLSEVTRLPLAGFEMKVVSPEGQPGDLEWTELSIQPATRSPHAAYFIYLMHRNQLRESVWGLVDQIPNIFKGIVERIES